MPKPTGFVRWLLTRQQSEHFPWFLDKGASDHDDVLGYTIYLKYPGGFTALENHLVEKRLLLQEADVSQ